MLVCSCFAVTERTLRGVIESGACDTGEVGDVCAAGTGCGGCLDEIEELLTGYRRACPVVSSG
ncbi:(2Fe-2S)-binding protein [Candidatus Protofrankia californiensis]|uniref:(2Fe-2S)-binding protein n=1 Tax=Candidatus Protofrankia californiensis TaxID=1839754 RepID=UPI00104165BA|nr:(2Fe-2S)-binding protein [Candidatus Protofrankia californiensis]